MEITFEEHCSSYKNKCTTYVWKQQKIFGNTDLTSDGSESPPVNLLL